MPHSMADMPDGASLSSACLPSIMPHSTADMPDGAILYSARLQAQAANLPFQWQVKNERLAAGLCYTSGTTGNPKVQSALAVMAPSTATDLTCSLQSVNRSVKHDTGKRPHCDTAVTVRTEGFGTHAVLCSGFAVLPLPVGMQLHLHNEKEKKSLRGLSTMQWHD